MVISTAARLWNRRVNLNQF